MEAKENDAPLTPGAELNEGPVDIQTKIRDAHAVMVACPKAHPPIIIIGNGHVVYTGKTVRGYTGALMLLIKQNGCFAVHGDRGVLPIQYIRYGAKISFGAHGNDKVIIAEQKDSGEVIEVTFDTLRAVEVLPTVLSSEQVATYLMRCVRETEGKYGRISMVKIVTGNLTRNMREAGLADLESYAKVTDYYSERSVLDVLDELISRGYLESHGDPAYPKVRLTELGEETLELERSVAIFSPLEEVGKRVDLNEEETALYEALRELRYRIAGEMEIPVYYLFSNKTLRQIALEKPRTIEELRQVEGIGQKKVEKYGEELLATVKEHLEGQ